MTYFNLPNTPRIRLYQNIDSAVRVFEKTPVLDLTSDQLQLVQHLRYTASRIFPMVRTVGGVDGHQDLANIASAFLLDLGKKPIYEAYCNSRRVDIAASDWSCIIECGDTNAPPIIDHLYTGYNGTPCSFVGVMPFQSFSEHAFMYVFKRGENWNNDIAQDIYYGGTEDNPRNPGAASVKDRTPPNVYGSA